MSNQHYTVNEEFEVELKVKVKLSDISTYNYLSVEQTQEQIHEAKKNMKKRLLNKLCNTYYQEENLSFGVDWCGLVGI